VQWLPKSYLPEIISHRDLSTNCGGVPIGGDDGSTVAKARVNSPVAVIEDFVGQHPVVQRRRCASQ
jgi:hypothetical protein